MEGTGGPGPPDEQPNGRTANSNTKYRPNVRHACRGACFLAAKSTTSGRSRGTFGGRKPTRKFPARLPSGTQLWRWAPTDPAAPSRHEACRHCEEHRPRTSTPAPAPAQCGTRLATTFLTRTYTGSSKTYPYPRFLAWGQKSSSLGANQTPQNRRCPAPVQKPGIGISLGAHIY
jgi:hypothetical protein